jgi:adenylate cyclase
MLNVFLARVCEPVRQQCGWVVKFLGDGLAAMFESRSAARNNHAERGIKAALLMMLVARDFRAWMSQRFPTHVLPEFAIGIGLHCGPSMVCEMGGGDGAETTVIGDTVNTASRLQDATKELMWSIAASRACVDAAGTRILCGRSRDVVLKGKAMPVQAVEVAGLLARDGGSPVERGFYAELRSAVTANSAVVASQRIAALGKRAYAQLDRPLAHEVAHS